MRRSELCWFFMFAALQLQTQMQMMTLVAATSRPLEKPNNNHVHVHPPGTVIIEKFNTSSSPAEISPRRNKVGNTNAKRDVKEVDDEYMKMNKIGSRPPNCNSKCYGCVPCEAIQVPTSTSHSINLQYANYLPEGWKCKCGPSFYSP